MAKKAAPRKARTVVSNEHFVQTCWKLFNDGKTRADVLDALGMSSAGFSVKYKKLKDSQIPMPPFGGGERLTEDKIKSLKDWATKFKQQNKL